MGLTWCADLPSLRVPPAPPRARAPFRSGGARHHPESWLWVRMAPGKLSVVTQQRLAWRMDDVIPSPFQQELLWKGLAIRPQPVLTLLPSLKCLVFSSLAIIQGLSSPGQHLAPRPARPHHSFYELEYHYGRHVLRATCSHAPGLFGELFSCGT